jgi:cytochrome c-type biogenesis protein CcmH/NrfG
MKKLTSYAMAAFLMLSVIPMQLNAAPGITPVSTTATVPVGSAEVEVLTARLTEIKEMDRSNMSSAEKKALRKEVRSIKSELREQASGGVYLSVGALILIVLLLILLL